MERRCSAPFAPPRGRRPPKRPKHSRGPDQLSSRSLNHLDQVLKRRLLAALGASGAPVEGSATGADLAQDHLGVALEVSLVALVFDHGAPELAQRLVHAFALGARV